MRRPEVAMVTQRLQGDAPMMPPEQLVADDDRSDNSGVTLKGMEPIGRVAHWNQSPNFSEIAGLLDPESEVKPGQFLGVWHGRRGKKILTIVRVGNSFEVNPNEVPELSAAREALGLGRSYGKEGLSTRIFRLIETSTMEEYEIEESGTGWRLASDARAPEELARAGDPIVLLPPEIAMQSIGGLSSDDLGINVGTAYGMGAAPVILTPQALQLHVGVFGNPGKGKSYLAGNLMEEAVRWGIPSLVLDINGEFINAANALGGKVITLPNAEEFGIALHQMTPDELVSVTPNVDPKSLYAELIGLAHDQLKNERPGKFINFEDVRDRIAQIGENTKASKASVGAAIARVMTLKDDPIIGASFDFVEQLVKSKLLVLDCRYLSLRQTRLIAAAGARELQRVGRDMARKAEKGDKEAAKWLSLYFVDEAHAVVPEDEKVVSTQVFYELARMGRHVRTGMVLSSQSPQDLNSSVLKRLQTRFVFSLEKDQLRSIQGVLADLDDKIVNRLPKLPRGVCAVSGSSEIVRHGFLLKVRERRTPVSGGTPNIFKERKKAPLTGK